jgi:hypothetical protein
MAWIEITRPKYQRDGLRYASDTTDEEWSLIEPHLPPPASCGRMRETSMREVVNSIFYIAQTGCQWRLLAMLSNFGPGVLANVGHPPSLNLRSSRSDRGAFCGLESQIGIVRAAPSGA